MPEITWKLSVELICLIAMEEGLRFAIREGGRTVGAGVVSKNHRVSDEFLRECMRPLLRPPKRLGPVAQLAEHRSQNRRGWGFDSPGSANFQDASPD